MTTEDAQKIAHGIIQGYIGPDHGHKYGGLLRRACSGARGRLSKGLERLRFGCLAP